MSGSGTSESIRLAAGDQLPATRLVESSESTGRTIPDRSREALIILYLHGPSEPWVEYVTRLEAAMDEIQHWYSRVVVIVSGDAGDLSRVRAVVPRLSVAAEEQPVLRDRLGLHDHRAVLLIVDRYGQIYHVAGGARAEELPPVAEIEEWATFLATQCPECGVIDEPGYGEWSLG